MEQIKTEDIDTVILNPDQEITKELPKQNTNIVHIKLSENMELAPIERQSLEKTFTPFFEQAAKLKEKAMGIVVTSIDQVEETALARSVRLKLRTIRTDTEKARKALNEDARKKTLTINSIAKIITSTITPIEAHLQAQEDVIKEHEAKQKEILRAGRTDILTPFIVDAFVDFEYYRLGEITEAKFQQLLDNFKRRWDEKMEKEKKVEEEKKLKDAENAKKLEEKRIENERLKKDKIESDRIAQRKLDKERSEREDEAAKAKQKEKEADQKLAESQEATQKAEDELRDQEEETLRKDKAIQEKEKRERKEKLDAENKIRLAPDKDKLIGFAAVIKNLKFPQVVNPEAAMLLVDVKDLLETATEILQDNDIVNYK